VAVASMFVISVLASWNQWLSSLHFIVWCYASRFYDAQLLLPLDLF